MLKQLNSELCEWLTRASTELHSARFHGPDAEAELREACKLVARASKHLHNAMWTSLAADND